MTTRAALPRLPSSAGQLEPGHPGISMSVTTTSGCCAVASVQRLGAGAACRHHLEVGSRSRAARASAPSTIDWSSAMRTRIITSPAVAAERQRHHAGACRPGRCVRACRRPGAGARACPTGRCPPAPVRRRAVVADLEADAPAVLRDRESSSGRAGVADDVGDGFAQGEGQGAILVRRERAAATAQIGADARRDQDALGVGDLVAQAFRPVAADGAANLGQRVARDALDVADLGAARAGSRSASLAGQLRLQHDDRQRVPEQIVQVAADALALGDPRHLLDGRLGHAQALDPSAASRRTGCWWRRRPRQSTRIGSQPQPGVPSQPDACAVIETSMSPSQANACRGRAAKATKAIA